MLSTLMKRTFLLLGTLCLSLYAQAQQYWLIQPKNTIKWNVAALTTHTFSLQYERTLSERTSLAIGINGTPAGKVPLAEAIRDRYLQEASQKNEAAAEDFARNAELSGWSVTPEFRFYTGKKPHQGFYLAPYARFAQYQFQWRYTFLDQEVPRPSTVNGSLQVLGAGLLAGYQWQFDQVTLDWWILGVGYHRNTLSLEAATDLQDLTTAQLKELETYVEDVSVKGHHLQTTVHAKGATGKGSMQLPGLRMGVCVGFRF